MSEAEWHVDFFTGLIVESQKRMNSETQTRLDADFIATQLQVPPGGSIADVPCGDGRLTVALAQRGFRMTAVDGSAGLLAAARERPEADAITWHQRDMRDLPWADQFDGLFCVGNSFAYFDDAGNQQFLAAVYRALKPGGRFLLETGVVAESILPHLTSHRWYPFGDLYFLQQSSYDPLTARLTSEYTLIRNGEIESKKAVYRVYLCRELLRLLESIGFQIVGTYASHAGDAFQLGSRRLWLVAAKELTGLPR